MRPPPFPTPKDVDRVMEFKPLQYSGETAAARAKRESDCRETVALVLRQLRKYDMTPISRVRQHLERYAKKLRSTRDMLLRGAPGVYNLWGSVDYQAGKLDVLRLEVESALAMDRRWFGYPKPEVGRTRQAAAHAFLLLMDFSSTQR
jgi:hypothetical protein